MFRINICKSKIRKIIMITIIAVIAAAVALMPLCIRTSVAHADSAGTPATFVSTRSGTISDPGSDRAFAEYDFQRSENNFHHIEAWQIADLVDSQHDVDLRTQSNAIQQTAYITNIPVLTVITHGQAGHAGNWSNDGIEDEVAYNNDSIIEKLRQQSGADVYVARSHIFSVITKNYRSANFESWYNKDRY